MFTGLKAINHFGRPDMASFFKFIQKKHNYVRISCLLFPVKRYLNQLQFATYTAVLQLKHPEMQRPVPASMPSCKRLTLVSD